MSNRIWMQVSAMAIALMFVTASGWAAGPKALAGQAAGSGHRENKKAEKAAELIDLNTATKEQFMALKGIDELTVQRIIKNRPYAKKDQLKSLKILTPQAYDRIRNKIIAKHPLKKK